MRVGILTYHSSYNFGANLQALAVQSALQKSGVEAVILNYQDNHKMELYRKFTSNAQAEAHENFMKNYFCLSPLLRNNEELDDYCSECLDAVLVGSDAVFRLKPAFDLVRIMKRCMGRSANSLVEKGSKQLPPYWLEWKSSESKQMFKASIAASATGTSYYLLKMSSYKKLYKAINDFDFISVRDIWTQRMIRFLSLGIQTPELCPDPVFALKTNFKIPNEEIPCEDLSQVVLISGHFPREWIIEFKRCVHDIGHKIFSFPNPDRSFLFDEADGSIELPLSPLRWFSYLSSAAGYIGIRFHALVSCLTNNTPAITTDPVASIRFRHKQKSRMYDLCKRAGILNRYFYTTHIARQKPEEILRQLFDRSSQERANEYASRAKVRFNTTIRRILAMAANRTHPISGRLAKHEKTSSTNLDVKYSPDQL